MADNTNTVTEKELDEIIETDVKRAHANHLITDKIIDPKSPHYGKKGQSYMQYEGNDTEQWFFLPNGSESKDDFIRVKWYVLDSNVAEGNYGRAKYIGLNSHIFGKVGELLYESKKWVFAFDEEKYNLNSPESVEIL